MDMTTGKVNTQSKALIALANAQLLVARVQAQARAADARRAVAGIQSRPVQLSGGFGGGFMLSRRPEDARDTISRDVLANRLDGNTAVDRLENLRRVGRLTDTEFPKAAASVASLGVELENIKVLGSAGELLRGTGGRELLTPKTGGGRSGGGARTKANPLADAAERFASEMAQIDGAILQVKRANLVELKDIAALDLQQVEVENRRAMIAIDKEVKDKHITAIQGDQLRIGTAIASALKAEQIGADLKAAQLRESAQLTQALNDNDLDLLRAQESLAVTAEQRRKIGLEILDHEKAQVRANAELTLSLYKLGEATEKQAMAAQDTLNSLDQRYSLRADSVRNSTRSPLDQYLADMDPARINERVQSLVVDELESVRRGINDGITDALGVQDPLLKGLIDMFIEQVLIRPIAQALQGSMGSGGGLFGTLLGGIGSIFGGASPQASLVGDVNSNILANANLFAKGTLSAPPGLAWVGEEGPELVRFRGGEQVFNQRMLRGMAANGNGRPIEAHFHYAGNMTERERRETTGQAMGALRREMGRSARMGG